MAPIRNSRVAVTLSLLFIALFTFLVFSNTLDNEFVNYDDDKLVYNNNTIKTISWKNAKKIFTSFPTAMYLPLVQCSYSVEYAIAGLNPATYHFTNLVLHISNTLLVFCLIYLLSGSLSASIVGALLFGVHPLHAESVAWISERKDQLSTIFFLGALIAYCFYLVRSKGKYYFVTLFAFVLSLLSKPMGVTLPLVLLLFDYRYRRQFERKMLIEKIPFFIISIIFGLLAILGRDLKSGAGAKELIPVFERLLLAGKSIIFYLGKIVWPTGLSLIYPYPEKIHLLTPSVFLSFFLLVVIMTGIFYSRKYTREIIFGTLFLFITLLPVLDIIPRAGIDFAADRYMYIPSFGLFYLIGLGWDKVYRWHVPREKAKKVILVFLLIVSIGSCSYLAYKRNNVWQNSGTLWLDVIDKYPGIARAHNNLGAYYQATGKTGAALREFEKAVELDPRYPDAYNNLGLWHGQKGEYEKAIVELKKAIALRPDYSEARNNLGMCYNGSGMFQEAINQYREALNVEPDAEIHYNLGNSYFTVGKTDKAVNEYGRALAIDPGFTKAHENLGILYGKMKMFEKAIAEHTIALSLEPDNARVYYLIAVEYYLDEQYDQAKQHLDKAVKLGYKNIDPAFMELLGSHR